MTLEEQRKILSIRMKPSAQHRAKIGAVTVGISIGEWIEQAIEEKVERERLEAKNGG